MADFVYIWEYHVRDDAIEQFRKAYGHDGDWHRFFNAANGYIRTELIQDMNEPTRFVTIDVWKSRQDRDRHVQAHQDEFKRIDDKCESYTVDEVHVGDFNVL